MRTVVGILALAVLAGTLSAQDDVKSEKKEKKGSGGLVRVFEKTEVQNMLKQLHLAYVQYNDDHKTGPAKQEQLAKYYENNAKMNELLEKQVTLIYGISGNQMRNQTTSLLAYEAIPDRNGIRLVLRCNGAIEGLSEEAFKKAPKAEK